MGVTYLRLIGTRAQLERALVVLPLSGTDRMIYPLAACPGYPDLYRYIVSYRFFPKKLHDTLLALVALCPSLQFSITDKGFEVPLILNDTPKEHLRNFMQAWPKDGHDYVPALERDHYALMRLMWLKYATEEARYQTVAQALEKARLYLVPHAYGHWPLLEAVGYVALELSREKAKDQSYEQASTELVRYLGKLVHGLTTNNSTGLAYDHTKSMYVTAELARKKAAIFEMCAELLKEVNDARNTHETAPELA